MLAVDLVTNSRLRVVDCYVVVDLGRWFVYQLLDAIDRKVNSHVNSWEQSIWKPIAILGNADNGHEKCDWQY